MEGEVTIAYARTGLRDMRGTKTETRTAPHPASPRPKLQAQDSASCAVVLVTREGRGRLGNSVAKVMVRDAALWYYEHMGYTKLFSSIITSTIWTEDDRTRIVWITMLALADKNGEVQGSIPGLARLSGVPVEAAEAALAKFLAPDKHSRTKDDGGRRIEEIDGGWHLLNHGKYRAMASRDEAKTAHAIRQKRYRERRKRNGRDGNVTDSDSGVTQDVHIAEADSEKEQPARRPKKYNLMHPTDDFAAGL